MKTWLYRTLETDDDGDPLDFGVVTARSVTAATKKLARHFRSWGWGDWGSERAMPVRLYPVATTTDVWETDGVIEIEVPVWPA